MTTTNYSIPELAAAQAQKHVTVNEALAVVDTAMNLTVIRTDYTAPPGSPAEGDKYIPAATATGDWAGHEGEVACYVNAAWIFFTPAEGWRAYDQTVNELLVWNGSAWVAWASSAGDGTAAAPAYSFASDTDTGMYLNAAAELAFSTSGTERLKVTDTQVIATVASLLVDDQGTDAGLTVSKQASTDDATLTLQTNYSTRTLFGTTGDDDTVLKVSPDGSTFYTAFTVDKDTGNVAIGAGSDATNRLLVSGQYSLFTNSGDLAVTYSKGAAANDLSFTLQDNFSTRTLLGLLADDNTTLKVSPDGSSYNTALVAYAATGAVELTQHPKFAAYCNYDFYVASATWTTLAANVERHDDQSSFDAVTNYTFTAPHDGYYAFGAGILFKANATVPTDMSIGLSVNGAAPTADRTTTHGDATLVTLESSVNVTGLLKLTASDTVEVQVYYSTNDGYVQANGNYFWGHQVA